MSSRSPRGFACGALLAFGASALAGQSPAELHQRIVKLEHALDGAVATTARRDSLRRAAFPLDTIHAGDLRVITTRALAARVAPAAATAWRVLEPTFGHATAVLRAYDVVVEQMQQPEGTLPRRSGEFPVLLPERPDQDLIARSLLARAAQIIATRQDSALTLWLKVTFTPAWPDAFPLAPVYVDLVTSSWSRARACYLGVRVACRAALGLSGREDPLREWYDAADRRKMVREAPAATWSRINGVWAQQCMNDGADDTCERALRENRYFFLETPLDHAARLGLMHVALAAGGAGAYERLIAATGQPIEARLAAASGLSGDSLIARWRGRVLAARPTTVAFGARSGWIAMAWSVLLGVLALRSTRWR